MNYFIDTEFSERAGERPTIDLISLAIVDEMGNEYYWESSEFNEALCNDWVKENVLPNLNPKETRRSRETIRREVNHLFSQDPDPVFWAYYGSYDWVAFCWLFGAMINLPKSFPMHPMDLQQYWVHLGRPDIKPPMPANQHCALVDARWNKDFHDALCCEESKQWRKFVDFAASS